MKSPLKIQIKSNSSAVRERIVTVNGVNSSNCVLQGSRCRILYIANQIYICYNVDRQKAVISP